MSKSKKIKYERAHLHFSKEQRIKVVQEIESGQLTRKEAMEKYNIVGHGTLNSWLLQYGSNPEGVVNKQYKKADQRLAAYKIITGESILDDIARSMQVARGTVSKWVRKYKSDVQQKTSSAVKEKLPARITHQEKDQQKEIEELKLKVAGLEMMIDIAEKELKIDIRKKPGTKR
jgi:transposase